MPAPPESPSGVVMVMAHSSPGAATPDEGNGSEKINLAMIASVCSIRIVVPRCDFCGDPHTVAWRYPCRDFAQSVAGKDHLRFASISYWGACDVCHDLVEAGHWDRLRRRSLRLFHAAHPGLPSEAVVAVEAELPTLWLRFQRHRSGPAEAVAS